jgi:two-component system chemotaxis response regulator CheB
MEVFLGVDGIKVEPRKVYLAPGERHMIIEPDSLKIRLDDSPPENYIKPAADPLFRSVARTFGKNSIAVVLTGMGYDGAEGAKHITAAQGLVIAQDPDEAIVDAMPTAVINAIADSMVVPLSNIPDTIVRIIQEKYDNSALEDN